MAQQKLPLKDILAAIDMGAKSVWDELSEDEKGQKVYTLLSKHPSLMKRPVLVIEEGISFVGWSQETRAKLNKA